MKHSNQICKIIAYFLFAILVLTVGSCTQSADLMATSPEETSVSLKHASISLADYICNPQSASFMAGEITTAGIVNLSVNPDNGNVIASVSTQDGWAFKSIQFFVGSLSQLPVNNGGNPQIGNFPVIMRFSSYQTTYGYELVTNANSISSDSYGKPYIIVAVHADVDKLDTNGRVLQSESAWMDGIQLNSRRNWAAYYIYYLMPCSQQQP